MHATLILGAGPGGTGPLVWAAQTGRLNSWLRDGVAVLDRTQVMGGNLGRYIINSDSLGAVYLECLDAEPARELLQPLRDSEEAAELYRLREGFPPLSLVGRYLARLGGIIEQAIGSEASSGFYRGFELQSLHLRHDGTVTAKATSPRGDIVSLSARTAVLALGGCEDRIALQQAELIPGVHLANVDPAKVMTSDRLFTSEGFARATELLDAASSRRIVILGGRHSAFSSGWLLTQRFPQGYFAPGDITILMRRSPPVFYATPADAERDQFPFGEDDLCPRTGRVHRLGGLRGDGRELWRRLAARPGTQPEERIQMLPLSDQAFTPAALCRFLEGAALVVPAFGYRSVTVPVYDAADRRLLLAADCGMPAVGRDARLLLADGTPIENIFGIGLGSGFRPWGAMGGEPSFDGQANSLWLYQNDIGGIVYQGVQECLRGRDTLRERLGFAALSEALSAEAPVSG